MKYTVSTRALTLEYLRIELKIQLKVLYAFMLELFAFLRDQYESVMYDPVSTWPDLF